MKINLNLIRNCCRFTHKTESIPVGCVPRAYWPYPVVSHVSQGAGMPNPPSPHSLADPWMQIFLVMWPLMNAGKSTTPRPVNRMTHRCKNISLPRTSFAGGKKETSQHPITVAFKGRLNNIWAFEHWLISEWPARGKIHGRRFPLSAWHKRITPNYVRLDIIRVTDNQINLELNRITNNWRLNRDKAMWRPLQLSLKYT